VGGKPWLPYGTQVIIPHGNGYLDNSRPTDRVFRVDDTGSTIGKLHRKTGTPHIDLRFMTNVWARKWSNKPVRIFVITGVAVVTEDYKLDPFYDPGIAKN
jgi:3D (Asp-Asp-Asp) domain-containing protein